MSLQSFAIVIFLLTFLSSCGKKKATTVNVVSESKQDLQSPDVPILTLTSGDWWNYKVSVELDPELAKQAPDAVDPEYEKKRTYLGKTSPGEGLPEVDTFEITISGQSIEKEFVEIYDDRIMMRGSIRTDLPNLRPMWMNQPIPFVLAGIRPGVEMGPLITNEGYSTRIIKVVARETIKVPAGEFPCIRLLMVGKDGEFGVQRTTWFSPGIGIVKEEKSRYAMDQLVYTESTNLIETSVGK